MTDSYRTFVQISVPPGSVASPVAAIEVSHFLDGPVDGLTRFEVTFHEPVREPVVLALGPVAATKLEAALLAGSFDHRASFERWDSDV